ncbi:MAG: helix-turn-helix transcriptional regulator [Thermoleophilia bacterium]|nr:helix-turn-helix transcriptional regulator [Thermoleophilia bacterium]
MVGRRFAENAVSLRRRSELSQAEAAERSGLHRTEISLLERALRLPQLDTIIQLAGAVEVEPCDLLDGMAWNVNRGRLHGSGAPPGSFEVRVGSRWVEA